jgi:ubiquinone/menaquinone biosynthesis C-methylase UbiE
MKKEDLDNTGNLCDKLDLVGENRRQDAEKIIKIVEHEKESWNNIFEEELKNIDNVNYLSYWWSDHYCQIVEYIDKSIKFKCTPSILEAGCGSGQSTLQLSTKTKLISLLDISPVALDLAKKLSKIYNKNNVEFIEGNILSMPFKDKEYDLTWNIGVLEHYDKTLIPYLLKEMIRVTKDGGYIAIGIPNPKSLAIKKAKFLANEKLKNLLKFIPGYRLDTENLYSAKEVEEILFEVSRKIGLKLSEIKVTHVGSPLLVWSPKFLIKFFKIFEKFEFIKKRKFLILIIAKINY